MAATLLSRVAFLTLFGLSACGGSPREITRMLPEEGDIRGGQLVRLEGQGFGHAPVEVFFGSKAAKAVTVEGERLVTIVAPVPDQSGAVDVRLRFADGVELLSPSKFLYQPVDGMRIHLTPLGSRSVVDDSSSD